MRAGRSTRMHFSRIANGDLHGEEEGSLKVFVTGHRGMLGQDLLPMLQRQGYDLHCIDLGDIDISREDDVHRAISFCMPNLVINCAAYTAVDKAEQERERAFAVNRDGAGFVANTCAKFEIPIIHVSTDYVFDGKSERPYLEDDPVHPLSTYGLSKWEGEKAIRSFNEQYIIIRTSWLFGAHGQNFVKTILRQAREKDELKIVDDQKGCPTWTGDLSEVLTHIAAKILQNNEEVPWGTYHFCGQRAVTWYEFATCIIEEGRKRKQLKTTRIIPIQTSDYPTAAKRPAWSVLDCSKIGSTFNIFPRPWLNGLKKVLDDLLCEIPL
jgi:dTDP-4-dehydrorhamnose reductase